MPHNLAPIDEAEDLVTKAYVDSKVVAAPNEVTIATVQPVDGTEFWVDPTGTPPLDQTAADARYINTAGDAMTGMLSLAADPTAPLHAATERFVRYRERGYAVTATNWNTTLTLPGPQPGIYVGSDTGGPGGGDYYYVTNYVYGGTPTDGLTTAHTQNMTQVAIPYYTGSIKWRARYSSTWLPWNTVGSQPDTGTWTLAGYQNGWGTYGGTDAGWGAAAYARIGKTVFLRGLVSGGTIAAGPTGTIFTLPVGYRPDRTQMFNVIAANNVGRMDIATDGTVGANFAIAGAGGNAYWSLNCSFLAA
jgi:hypothetical protein